MKPLTALVAALFAAALATRAAAEPLPRRGDFVAMAGDSITWMSRYSLWVEMYLLAARPDLDLRVMKIQRLVRRDRRQLRRGDPGPGTAARQAERGHDLLRDERRRRAGTRRRDRPPLRVGPHADRRAQPRQRDGHGRLLAGGGGPLLLRQPRLGRTAAQGRFPPRCGRGWCGRPTCRPGRRRGGDGGRRLQPHARRPARRRPGRGRRASRPFRRRSRRDGESAAGGPLWLRLDLAAAR